MKRTGCFWILAAVALWAGCDKEEEQVEISYIELNESAIELMVGDSCRLELDVNPATAAGSVVWECYPTTVATVDETGLVRGVALGSAFVIASGGGKSAYCAVTVRNPDITDKINPKFALALHKLGRIADPAHITLEEARSITHVDLSRLSQYDRPASLAGIEYFSSLEVLDCAYCNLTWLNVSSNSRLRYLDCSNNALKKLVLGDNIILERIGCAENRIAELNVSGCPNLTLLDCQVNEIAALDISRNKKLRTLACDGNKLSSVDISNNLKMETFTCAYNPGYGALFLVTAWFDNGSIPRSFQSWGWGYDGRVVEIVYQKK